MTQSHDQRVVRRPPSLPASSPNLTTQQLEAVIRRAVELQVDTSARLEEGVSEADALRIGQELGLEPATVRRAIAEVRGGPVEERGALLSLAGPRMVQASRVVTRPAPGVLAELETHLRDAQFMIPRRRFPDRTRFVRDGSLAAGLARLARGITGSSHRAVDLKQVDVSVSPIDASSCLVRLGVDLAGTRGGLVGGVIGGSGGAAAAWAAVTWATALPDPLALAGVPLLAAAWFGTRAIFQAVRRSALEKVEALLDQVQHGDLS